MLHRFWPPVHSATRLGNKTCVLLMIPPLLLDSWNYNNSASRLGNKTCVLLMIPPLLLDSWIHCNDYNNGMACYYEISRGYYFLLCHPTFRSCLSVGRHKRHKRLCIYYSGSSATFHPLLIGDLVFKLNPGPTGIMRIPAIVSLRDVNVNNNTAASTGSWCSSEH